MSGYDFYQYKYPNTDRNIIIKTLEHFNFKLDYQDDINSYYKKDNLKVPVTVENIVKALNIHEIIHQSRISDEEFSKVLKEIRKQVNIP